jgi:hypothetical protein
MLLSDISFVIGSYMKDSDDGVKVHDLIGAFSTGSLGVSMIPSQRNIHVSQAICTTGFEEYTLHVYADTPCIGEVQGRLCLSWRSSSDY